MPSKWEMVDSSFPTFSDNEKPAQQIGKLIDYMYILVEELKQQLSNLDTQNWNNEALESFRRDTTADLESQLAQLALTVQQSNSMLTALSVRVDQLSGAVDTLREETESLAQGQRAAAQILANVDEKLLQLQSIVTPDGSGGGTIGTAGQDLRLYGTVYINDVAVE